VTSLSTTVLVREGRTILTVSGELDFAVVEELREAIDRLIRTGQGNIEVDLSRVLYLDSSSIGALVGGRRLADDLGEDYQVGGAYERVRYVLNVTGVLDYLSRDHHCIGTRRG
jgi:anti-sigma B factor antagonist